MKRYLVAAVAVLSFAAPAAANPDWPFQPMPIGATPEYQPAGALAAGRRRRVRRDSRQRAGGRADAPRAVRQPAGDRRARRHRRLGRPDDALRQRGRRAVARPGLVAGARRRHPSRRDGHHAARRVPDLGRRTRPRPPADVPRADARVGERRAARGRPADIVLRDRDQVVLVHGGDVEIHRSFTFKPVRL